VSLAIQIVAAKGPILGVEDAERPFSAQIADSKNAKSWVRFKIGGFTYVLADCLKTSLTVTEKAELQALLKADNKLNSLVFE
jgi:hypothetical protein